MCVIALLKFQCAASQRDGGIWQAHEFYQTFNKPILWMEKDPSIGGFILISTYTCLLTTDGTDTYIIAGSQSQAGFKDGFNSFALFSGIYSFVQSNDSHIIAVDYHNNRLRYINRVLRETGSYMGCEHYEPTCVDPHTKLIAPYSVIRAGRYLFVKERFGWRIHKLDLISNGHVFFNLNVQGYAYSFPSFHLILESENSFLLTSELGIFRAHADYYGSSYYELEKLIFHGFGSEGNVTEIVDIKFGKAMVFLHDNLTLVAESGNHRIRVLDFAEMTTFMLCVRGVGSDCLLLPFINSLLLMDGYLYVSADDRLLKLVKIENGVLNDASSPVITKGVSEYIRSRLPKFNQALKPGSDKECPNNITLFVRGGEKAAASFDFLGMKHTAEFPVGSHKYSLSSSGVSCSFWINVMATEDLPQTLAFSCQYENVTCDKLDELAFDIAMRTAKEAFKPLESVCGCTVREPRLFCDNSSLQIVWQTNHVLSAVELSSIDQVIETLQSGLKKTQDQNKSFFMAITVISEDQVLVVPRIDGGSAVKPQILPLCPDGFQISSTLDKCV